MSAVGKRERTDVPGVFRRLKANGKYSYDAVVLVDGRQKWRAFATKDKARAAKAATETDRNRGDLQTTSETTLHEYLRRHLRSRRDVRPETLAEYQRLTERYTLQHFSARLKLSDVTPARLTKFVEWLMQDGRGTRGGDLSNRAIRNIIGPLTKALRHAAATGELRHDPAAHLTIPKRYVEYTEQADGEDADVRHYEPEQVAAIVSMAREPYATWFALLASTGLRVSESLGLRWRDVDLGSEPTVSVRRRWRLGRFDAPKSTAGRRTVAIDRALADRLAACRGVAAGDDLVFASRTGRPLDADNVRSRVLRPLAEEAGASVTGFHAFRHYYASEMIARGVNVVALSKALGHSSPSVTLNVYSHVLKDRGAPALALATEWPDREESREILADYVAQHEVADDGEIPPDPDPDEFDASTEMAA